MDLFQEIEDELQHYPGIEYQRSTKEIRVLPSDTSGFEITISFDHHAFVVHFDGWHEHFDSARDAFDCFVFGLSDRCRLKIVSKGDVPVRWGIQSLEDGEWVDGGHTGLLFYPFWRSTSISYRQNRVVRVKPNEVVLDEL